LHWGSVVQALPTRVTKSAMFCRQAYWAPATAVDALHASGTGHSPGVVFEQPLVHIL
jgi:hypothetical protein